MNYRCVAVAVLVVSLQGTQSLPAGAAPAESSCVAASLRQLRAFGVLQAPTKLGSATLYFKNFEVDVDALPHCVISEIIIIARVHPFHLRLTNLSPWLASLDVKSDDVPSKGFYIIAKGRNGRVAGFPYEAGTPVVMISLIETQNRHVAVGNHPYTDAPGMGIARCRGQLFFFAQVWDEPAPNNPPEFWPDCP